MEELALGGGCLPTGPTPAWRAALARADAARRLGARAVGLWGWHRLRLACGLLHRRLGDAASGGAAELPGAAPAPPALPPAHAAAVLAAARVLACHADWHGAFDATAHALDLDLFAPGDVRPVWERNRLAELPLLAQAARLDPQGGHLARAAALLADWQAANPAFRGPAWACGQEAALRVLHLALALALLEADRDPPAGMRALIALHARRIAATTAYAEAQDNNHPVSEAAGLFACGLLLRDGGLAARGARRLARAVRRLVSEDGAFAQPSAEYHRLLLDTLAVAEWLRRRHGAPEFAAPFAARAAAATTWLARVTDPGTGALPKAGPCDSSRLADLGLRGEDARGSVERAARLFAGAGAGCPGDTGCAWLGLPCPAASLPRAGNWRSAGWAGFAAPGARALLRTGAPLRFRPGQADLLHLDLWDGPLNLLRDGGTGSYSPGAELAAACALLAATAGHNTIGFDGADQMRRVSRFLHAHWPRSQALPDGAAYRDHRGNTHQRRVSATGRLWLIEDAVAGPFRALVLRWRLAPAEWRLTATGAASPLATIALAADAPLTLRLAQGWESPRYGTIQPVPVLEAHARAPITRLASRIELP